MALHHELRIFRPALDLTKYASRLVSQMPRNYRAVDGAALVRHTRIVLHEIRQTNKAVASEERVRHLDRLLDEISDIEVDLEVCEDLKLITPHAFAKAAALAGSVGKQATRWKESYLPDSRPSRRP